MGREEGGFIVGLILVPDLEYGLLVLTHTQTNICSHMHALALLQSLSHALSSFCPLSLPLSNWLRQGKTEPGGAKAQAPMSDLLMKLLLY